MSDQSKISSSGNGLSWKLGIVTKLYTFEGNENSPYVSNAYDKCISMVVSASNITFGVHGLTTMKVRKKNRITEIHIAGRRGGGWIRTHANENSH